MSERLGKNIALTTHKNIVASIEVMNCLTLKTIFLKFEGYIQPLEENTIQGYEKIVTKLKKDISNHIRFNPELNKYFRTSSIVIDYIKYKAVNPTKKSFFNVEVTIYPKVWFDINRKDYQMMLKQQSKLIIDAYFPFDEFEFKAKNKISNRIINSNTE